MQAQAERPECVRIAEHLVYLIEIHWVIALNSVCACMFVGLMLCWWNLWTTNITQRLYDLIFEELLTELFSSLIPISLPKFKVQTQTSTHPSNNHTCSLGQVSKISFNSHLQNHEAHREVSVSQNISTRNNTDDTNMATGNRNVFSSVYKNTQQ